jgi:hypothetical protein
VISQKSLSGKHTQPKKMFFIAWIGFFSIQGWMKYRPCQLVLVFLFLQNLRIGFLQKSPKINLSCWVKKALKPKRMNFWWWLAPPSEDLDRFIQWQQQVCFADSLSSLTNKNFARVQQGTRVQHKEWSNDILGA